jgi:hypothetical protein
MKFTIWDIEGIRLKVGVCARARSGKKKKKEKKKKEKLSFTC